MIFYHETKKDVLKYLNTDEKKGLSSAAIAGQMARYGANRLAKKKKKSYIFRFFDQFKDVMILILLLAAAVSFTVACIQNEPNEFVEPILILIIVTVNAIVGVFQESKAEKALESLESLSAQHASVIRDGTKKRIPAEELVPGDIICLESGDYVPADARLLASSSLKSEESALTGESLPSEKNAAALVPENAALGDRVNMVFSGCSITAGTATAVVTATGMNTEMGKIASLLSGESDEQTPLQKKLTVLGSHLGIMALAACGVIFVVGILGGIPALDIFMTSVSLAVSAIPEGLPAIVTIVLSIGVQRMVQRGALIRKLPAVETLGSASVICSDKTGTLTQNRMTVVELYTAKGQKRADCRTARKLSPEEERLLGFGTLCSNGSLVSDGKITRHVGDPTETAIIAAARQFGLQHDALTAENPRYMEIPFDSERKRMCTVNRIGGKTVVIVKGAFDMLAKCCVGGNLAAAKQAVDDMSRGALRVIAVAYKEIQGVPHKATAEQLENNLTFVGLIGMIDPPRPEAKQAVSICKKAGIKPVMITGDHILTASAIASDLGILSESDRAITGEELDRMDDVALDNAVENIAVYARVSPENKLRIVKAWRKKERVVAMTGDGVNDAPALKAADIGCAMGITGTDVAKGAADMTLTDDNFATIVDAVREGRGIYANIRKVVGFLLGTNIGEVITVFAAMVLWHKTPLISMQLLWINLVTDGMPAIALGMEKVEADIMEKPPKPKKEGIFAHGLGVRVVLQGCMFGLLSLAAFAIGERAADGMLVGGQTLAFMVLSLSQLVQAYNMRSEHSLFSIGVFSNRSLNKATLVSVLLVSVVMFTPLRNAFGLMLLPLKAYLIGLALILLPVPVTEISKLLRKKNKA